MKTLLLALVWLACGRLLAQPVIISQPTNQIVLNGSNVTFGVTVSGSGPFTYQWQFNGTNLPNNIITSVAGNGSSQFSGDGGTATNAGMYYPTGVAEDSAGEIYIADLNDSRIRMVNTNGIIMTVAGTNKLTFSGDGGPAKLAGLYAPYGICMDAWGNYFIADSGNNRIRKVDTNGIISTVAGTNTSGFFGDGGPATNAALSNPHGVAVDAFDNLFIADYGNNRIRRVDTNGFITTVAGTNVSGYFGDGGAATNAWLARPQGVAVDAYGNVFIADSGNNRIRRLDTNGIITTVAGTNSSGYAGDGGPATKAHLSGPTGVTVDAFGYLFISDCLNYCVRQVDANGIITTVAGNNHSGGYSGDGGASTNASLSELFGLAMNVSGGLVIADEDNFRIRRVTLGRNPLLQFNNATTNNVGNYQVIVTSPSGNVTSSVVSLTVVLPAIVSQPQSCVVTNGNSAAFSVVAYGTNILSYQWYFNTNAVCGATNALLRLSSVAASQAGNYFCVIADAAGSVTSAIVSLIVLSPPGIAIQPANQTVLAGSSVTLNVAVTGSGPLTYQWQLNGTNLPNRNGFINTVVGKGNQSGFSGDGGPATSALLSNPSGVAFDAAGDLYIADQGNFRIRMMDTNFVSTTNGLIGNIHTIAGNGSEGFSGDGGPATNAGFSCMDTTVDASGNFYIATGRTTESAEWIRTALFQPWPEPTVPDFPATAGRL